MNCKNFDELLAAYASGDATATEREQVDAHVASCDGCRAELADYTALTSALSERRELVPPAEKFLAALPAPARVVVRPILRRALEATVSLPGIAVLASIWLAAIVYAHRDAIVAYLTEGTLPTGNASAWLEKMNSLLAQGGDQTMWIVVSVYALVTVGILASTGAITARFLRSN